jgi:formate/nitrite transporter FocA (FNT family)
MSKKPIIVAVALISGGFAVQINVQDKTAQAIAGCAIFVGLIMFAISLHKILDEK